MRCRVVVSGVTILIIVVVFLSFQMFVFLKVGSACPLVCLPRDDMADCVSVETSTVLVK